MMILPPNYGQHHQVVRKGNLNGGILESIAQAQNAIANYERESEELKKTQDQLQFLIATGSVMLFVGGAYGVYKIIQEVTSSKSKSKKRK